jgi:hypothetical protein
LQVLGTRGFDFVLSDAGLDLFMPDKPKTEAELVRYYTFRRTGRRGIGIPQYMSTGSPAIATESPTGPGQMEVRYDLLLNLVSVPPAPPAAPGAPEDAPEDPCADRLKCLNFHLFGTPEPPKPPHGPLRVSISIDEFMCMLEGVRCWQLAGSVYRGIMTELPRVVATIWAERIAGATGDPKSYHNRFPIETNDGLREIFCERLETALPDYGHMRFETYGGLDVKITNEGLFFPALADSYPNLKVMLEAIRDGEAGNPVFTDSMPPPPE